MKRVLGLLLAFVVMVGMSSVPSFSQPQEKKKAEKTEKKGAKTEKKAKKAEKEPAGKKKSDKKGDKK